MSHLTPDELIDAVEDITAGSEPEVEIRAVGLHAVELLVAALRTRGVPAHARDLDTFLWNRGGGPVAGAGGGESVYRDVPNMYRNSVTMSSTNNQYG